MAYFIMAALMTKREAHGTVTMTGVLGQRVADTVEEANGVFMVECRKLKPGFSIDELLTSELEVDENGALISIPYLDDAGYESELKHQIEDLKTAAALIDAERNPLHGSYGKLTEAVNRVNEVMMSLVKLRR